MPNSVMISGRWPGWAKCLSQHKFSVLLNEPRYGQDRRPGLLKRRHIFLQPLLEANRFPAQYAFDVVIHRRQPSFANCAPK